MQGRELVTTTDAALKTVAIPWFPLALLDTIATCTFSTLAKTVWALIQRCIHIGACGDLDNILIYLIIPFGFASLCLSSYLSLPPSQQAFLQCTTQTRGGQQSCFQHRLGWICQEAGTT